MNFEEFLDIWTSNEEFTWQTCPQYEKFLNKEGKFCLNYLIDFSKLEEQFNFVCKHLKQTNHRLNVINDSPRVLKAEQICSSTVQKIKKTYEEDYYYLENKTGKILK